MLYNIIIELVIQPLKYSPILARILQVYCFSQRHTTDGICILINYRIWNQSLVYCRLKTLYLTQTRILVNLTITQLIHRVSGLRHVRLQPYLGALKWQKIIVTNSIWLTNKLQMLRSFVLIGLNRFDVHRSSSVTFTITCLILSVFSVDARAWPGTPSNKIYSLLTSVYILSLMVIMLKQKKFGQITDFYFWKKTLWLQK